MNGQAPIIPSPFYEIEPNHYPHVESNPPTDADTALIRSFQDLNFDAFALNAATQDNPLFYFCSYLRYFSKFDVRPSVYNDFTYAIQELYLKSNPYHNATHGADVLQSVFFYLYSCEAASVLKLSDVEVYALLMSAAVHDVGHPGHKNDFEVHQKTTLATVFNDQSVLENYHVAVAFSVMQQEKDYDILGYLSPEDQLHFRKIMISTVLATDMVHHNEHLSSFKAMLDRGDDLAG